MILFFTSIATNKLNPDTAYVRVTGNYIGADSVITVNEKISEVISGETYQWVNTGVVFDPTEYEDFVIEYETPDYIKDEAKEVADKVTVAAKSSGRRHNAGLFAYNCRHKMQAYESETVLEEIPDAVIEHYRKAETKQKSTAQRIRALKIERDTYTALYKKTHDTEVYRRASALDLKVKSLMREYTAISKAYDMPMSSDIVKVKSAK